jgi:hypothetical protein
MKPYSDIFKDATVSSVHTPTALGNQKPKPKKKLPSSVEEKGAAKLWPIEITKADPEQRLIFGWASVVEVGGEAIIDKQGDIIPPDVLEKAAYDFVLHSRSGGDMHVRRDTSFLVESIVFTAEKQKAIGIDLGKVGWFVGFKVLDEELWATIKRGERPEFSIGGRCAFIEED